ncbi:MAG TPA: Gfo/Idh/MocA family oxidoreductase [Gemmatimonadaceae bacterium]|nr:Gfo/Idh/MocA family oxidoreductase [Gemmatimonadaceae bacterium]
MSDDAHISRREFVGTTATAALAFTIVPRHVLGGPGYVAPSDRLNVAIVGAGGMGMSNMTVLAAGGENIVAVCDVDYGYVERSLAGRTRTPVPRPEMTAEEVADQRKDYANALTMSAAFAKAKRYDDFRVMLEKEKHVDGVVVATPDHTHAAIAHAAMLAGKHVYVQKPLTYSVYEARLLARTAAERPKLVTQMGNQGHSLEGTRRIVEMIAAGVIGPVREVHVWTDRPLRYWAQGIPRPTQPAVIQPTTAQAARLRAREAARLARQQAAQAAQAAVAQPAVQQQVAPPTTQPPVPPRWNMRTVDQALLKQMAADAQSPPPTLHWDLFLGGAPDIPYHPAYHPFSWRGWIDFGVSAIGDMGAHLMDQPYWALDLGLPTSVLSTSTPWGGPATNPGSYPLAMTSYYEFPARGDRPPVKLTWYDGGLTAPMPEGVPLPEGDGGGGLFVGEKGYITYETYGEHPKVYPESAAAAALAVPKTMPRVAVPHEINWAQACKGHAKASSPFEYAARLTETMLLGVAALRAGERIDYDGAAMRITNVPDANQFLTREYRKGWEL